MDLMFDRKEFDKALQQILQGRNASGPDVVDFTATQETLTVVVTGRSVEIPIEAQEIGSVRVPIAVVAKLKMTAKTYKEKERLLLHASKGQIRLEGMTIKNEGIQLRKVARRAIDIPQDASQIDILALPRVRSAAEIEESELGGKVRAAEKKLKSRLDSAAKSLAEYGISRDHLHAMVEAQIRENALSLRKALSSE